MHTAAGAILLLTLHGLAFAQTAPATQPSAWQFEAVTDRADAIYRPGEEVTFRVALTKANKVQPGEVIEYRITKDNFGPVIASGTLTTASESVELRASLAEPGFLRCDLTLPSMTPPVVGVVAAGISPEQIKPSQAAPADFDAYWKKQREIVSCAPATPVLTPIDSGDPQIEAFDVRIDCPGGAPLSGYLALPKDSAARSLPIILYPHSAGVRSSDLKRAVRMAKLGAMCLDFNAHGIPNGKPDEFYKALLDGALKDYRRRDAGDIERIYFRGMFLRLIRAIDFLTTRPQWDGKTFVVIGSSQGGGQSLIAAGLEPRITLCLASVPAICDHTGFVANRVSGWPKLVQVDADGKPNEAEARVAPYFDAMNFAARIKCPTVVTVGFIDRVCPPTSVYAAYNAIPSSDKRIIARPLMAHTFPQDLQDEFNGIVQAHFANQAKN
jgi:cephalosporin-C deacetylase-like acetyl esterase